MLLRFIQFFFRNLSRDFLRIFLQELFPGISPGIPSKASQEIHPKCLPNFSKQSLGIPVEIFSVDLPGTYSYRFFDRRSSRDSISTFYSYSVRYPTEFFFLKFLQVFLRDCIRICISSFRPGNDPYIFQNINLGVPSEITPEALLGDISSILQIYSLEFILVTS